MRALRASFFATPGDPEATIVVRDSDITDTLESMRERLLDDPSEEEIAQMPEGSWNPNGRPYIHFDIFETEDSSIEDATIEAMNRRNPLVESDATILYLWTVEKILPMLSPTGLMLTPDPSPLPPDVIEAVLGQVARHPKYQDGQTVETRSPDGTRVRLTNGKVERP